MRLPFVGYFLAYNWIADKMLYVTCYLQRLARLPGVMTCHAFSYEQKT